MRLKIHTLYQNMRKNHLGPEYSFTADFEARLPKYLRNALHPEAIGA